MGPGGGEADVSALFLSLSLLLSLPASLFECERLYTLRLIITLTLSYFLLQHFLEPWTWPLLAGDSTQRPIHSFHSNCEYPNHPP